MVSSKLRMLFGLGTVCGVAAMLVLVTGCPLVPGPTPCTEDTECDDTLYCNGAETCVDGACVDGIAPCVEGETCDEDNDLCYVVCETDAECDDADACTTDACVDGACVNTAMVCDDEDLCTTDECVDGECVYTPMDCDDADACTTDECVDGECVNTPMDCDDEDLCTTDECVDGACVNTPVECLEGEVCDAATGECIAACETDEDCADDGLFCTGDPVCTDGVCDFAGDPCVDAGQLCDEDTGTCVECLTDDDCDVAGGETCLDGACIGGACETDEDCDDGLFCNGIETCDLDTLTCVTGDRPCDDTDADGNVITCDEGAVEECSEGDTAAVCTACAVETIDFTLNQDDLTGTTGHDSFKALLALPSQGTLTNTLQTGDMAEALAGTDTLDATFTGSADISIVPTLDGIEVINISDYTALANTSTLVFTNISGATDLNTVGSTDTMTATNIGAIIGLGINGTDQGIAATFKAAATSGTTDVLTLTLTETTDAATSVATIGTVTSGFETMNVVSAGDTGSVLRQIDMTGVTTALKTLNVSGTQDVQIRLIDDSLTTLISASGMTAPAGFTLGYGTSVTGTAAYTAFSAADFAIGNLAGGPGDDMFIFANFLASTDADGTTEYIDGGDGTDGMQISLDESLTTTPHFRYIENYYLNAEGNFTLSLINVGGIETFYIESDATVTGSQNVLTLSNFPNIPALAYRGNGAEGSQYFDHVTYTSLGASGTSDSLVITVGNRGTALGSSTSANAFRVGAIIANLIETMTVTVSDVPASASTPTTFDDITSDGLNSLTFTVPGDLTVGTIDGEASLLTTVNFVGVTGRLRLETAGTITDLGPGATVTLTGYSDGTATTPITCDDGAGNASAGITVSAGAGDDYVTLTGGGTTTFILNGEGGEDTLVGAAVASTINGGSGDDVITGGAAADTLTGGSGNDTITGAAGVDTIVATSGTNTINGGAGIDVISCGTGVDTLVLDYNNAGTDVDAIGSFTAGASGDQFDYDLSAMGAAAATGLNAGQATTLVVLGAADTAVGAADATVITECTAACTPSATTNVTVLVGTSVASVAALQTALEVGGTFALVINATASDVGDAFLVVYSDGTDAFLAGCWADTETLADTDFEAGDLTCVNVAKMTTNAAITASEFATANFDFIP